MLYQIIFKHILILSTFDSSWNSCLSILSDKYFFKNTSIMKFILQNTKRKSYQLKQYFNYIIYIVYYKYCLLIEQHIWKTCHKNWKMRSRFFERASRILYTEPNSFTTKYRTGNVVRIFYCILLVSFFSGFTLFLK